MEEEVREESPAAVDAEPSSSGAQVSTEPPSSSIREEAFESFDCCICLDLIYMPVVLACGHICCFWCIHYAMNGFGESHCPICRKPYLYFPAVCQLLHNLLSTLKPTDYKKREEELGLNLAEKDADSSILEHDGDSSNLEHPQPLPGADEKSPREGLVCSEQVSISDVLCAGCNQLLFQPAVLNCGHAYCALCVVNLRRENLRCQVCGGQHPGEPPQVCICLNSLLAELFPQEFAARRADVQARLPSSAVQAEAHQEPLLNSGKYILMIHPGVGCDYCGMYPIIGKRYNCKDCKEKMGFDLCEGCYEARSMLPPRFNQHHTPDHVLQVQQTELGLHLAHLISPDMLDS